jgi:hypothetical protein
MSVGKDTLFNVCLEVGDVDQVTKRCSKLGSDILQEPITISDGYGGGEVRYSRIKSIVGNLQHSIVCTRKFTGLFLPGFERWVDNCDVTSPISAPELTHFMDHVTYVCHTGESHAILSWYAECFGMKRFLVNSKESCGHYKKRCNMGEFQFSLLVFTFPRTLIANR